MVHIIGQDKVTTTQEGVPLLQDTDLDDGGWEEDPEYSDEFEPALWILLERYDIQMDPTLSFEDSMAGRDIGVLTAKFWKWTISLNWQTVWARHIPPHHMAVEFDGTEVGIISPWLTLRTCWKCRRGNPIGRDGKYSENGLWVYSKQIGRVPAVLPAHPCPGRLQKVGEEVVRIPCGEYDWYASFVSREQFQRDAAEEVAKDTNDDTLAQEMAVVHDPSGQEKPRYVNTEV